MTKRSAGLPPSVPLLEAAYPLSGQVPNGLDKLRNAGPRANGNATTELSQDAALLTETMNMLRGQAELMEASAACASNFQMSAASILAPQSNNSVAMLLN